MAGVGRQVEFLEGIADLQVMFAAEECDAAVRELPVKPGFVAGVNAGADVGLLALEDELRGREGCAAPPEPGGARIAGIGE